MNTRRYRLIVETEIRQSFEADVDMDAYADWLAHNPGDSLELYLENLIYDGEIELPGFKFADDYEAIETTVDEAEPVAPTKAEVSP